MRNWTAAEAQASPRTTFDSVSVIRGEHHRYYGAAGNEHTDTLRKPLCRFSNTYQLFGGYLAGQSPDYVAILARKSLMNK